MHHFFFTFIKGMLVRVNERDLTREFENTSYVYLTQNLSVRWENKTLSASFLQTCESPDNFLSKRLSILEVQTVRNETVMNFRINRFNVRFHIKCFGNGYIF